MKETFCKFEVSKQGGKHIITCGMSISWNVVLIRFYFSVKK